MINKSRFQVTNNKKLLHKIGKRWVTVSAITLALLSGGALASSATTHADTISHARIQNIKPIKKHTNKKANNKHQVCKNKINKKVKNKRNNKLGARINNKAKKVVKSLHKSNKSSSNNNPLKTTSIKMKSILPKNSNKSTEIQINHNAPIYKETQKPIIQNRKVNINIQNNKKKSVKPLFERVKGLEPYHYIYSPTNSILRGKGETVDINAHRGFTGKIIKIGSIKGQKVYTVRWHHQNFLVNAKHTHDAYVQPHEFKEHKYGLIKHVTIQLRKSANIYNTVNYTHTKPLAHIQAGSRLTVVGLKSFGQKGYKRTRFVLSNGLIITANKNYVEFV